MIRWKCRQCGEGLEAPESMAGDLIECCACGSMIRVPVETAATVRSATSAAPIHAESKKWRRVFIASAVVFLVSLLLTGLSESMPSQAASYMHGFFSFIAVLSGLVLGFLLFALLGAAPGLIASQRNHPQREAINVCAWVGLLLTFGLLWVVALVWAYTAPEVRR